MKFTSVTNKKYINYKETEPNTVIATGKVISSSPNKYNADNNDWQIKPLDGGPVINLFGAGHLEWAMSSVTIGTIVQVTYLGMDKVSKKGHKFNGKDAHSFDVAIADTGEQLEPLTEAQSIKKVEKAFEEKTTGTVDLSDLD